MSQRLEVVNPKAPPPVWAALRNEAYAAAKSEAAAAASWQQNAYASLDETTGIDLDREAADLLRFQQAYSACARIIQVGRETFDSLLQVV